MEDQSEENLKPTAPGVLAKPRRLDSGLMIGLSAIAINIITVFIYMYQANLMLQQQHTAVWPYVEWLPSMNEKDGYYIEVKNTGVGPALIKNVKMKLNGKEIGGLGELFEGLIGTSNIPCYISTLNKRVLSANASIRPFHIPNFTLALRVDSAMRANDFELIVCYESIYGEKWACRGTEVAEGDCP